MKMEREYWNKKYEAGGISGRGSIGRYRNWKWNTIHRNIGSGFRSVIDVGCGDLLFWQHPIANHLLNQEGFQYLGIDISDHIIRRNRKKNPKLEFINSPAHIEQTGRSAEVVLAMDLLFHIMDDNHFELSLDNLCKYTTHFLVIYNWKKNPFKMQGIITDEVSQTYRHLSNYDWVFIQNDCSLFAFKDVPYDPFGRMYFFRRLLY